MSINLERLITCHTEISVLSSNFCLHRQRRRTQLSSLARLAHTLKIYYPPSIPCSPPCNLPSPSGLGQVLGGNCIGRAGLCVSANQVVDTLHGIDETCYCLKRQSALSQILCIQCTFTIRNPYRYWSLDGKPIAAAIYLPSRHPLLHAIVSMKQTSRYTL